MDSRELGHITSDLSAYDTMGNPEIMQIALINEKIRRQERIKMPGGVSSYISYNISYNFLTASMNFFVEQWAHWQLIRPYGMPHAPCFPVAKYRIIKYNMD